MQIFNMIVQFILGLSLIVGIHELGHMLFAKLFGMRVESYTIGFHPRIFHFKWGETEYGLGALPFGGSVKIAGMVDESLDTAYLKQKIQPWEFRAKPAWQRIIVMLGGIIFNTVSGMLIFISLAWKLGDAYLAKEEVNKYGILPNAVAISMGFEPGDKIININGKDFTKFDEVISPKQLLKADGYYTVERNGAEVIIYNPANLLSQISADKSSLPFLAPRIPFVIAHIPADSSAAQAGLQAGDRILTIDGKEAMYFDQLATALASYADTDVALTYLRDGEEYHTTVKVDKEGKLGIFTGSLLEYTQAKYNLGQSIVVGSQKAISIVAVNVVALGKIIKGTESASQSLSGPIGIAQIFSKNFDWIHFWNIVGLLSMALGFTNLLPIPALDGGHVVLLGYEMITRRKISDKRQQDIQKVGMAILLLLIGFGLFNDLRKLLF